MRRFWIGWIFVFVSINLMGCGVVDWFFGVDKSEQGDDKKKNGGGGPSESPAAGVGGVLKYFIPGADTALVGIAAIWAAVRGRKWKTAAETTANTLIDFKQTDIGEQAWERLKGMLAKDHDQAGIQKFVNDMLAKLKFERAMEGKSTATPLAPPG